MCSNFFYSQQLFLFAATFFICSNYFYLQQLFYLQRLFLFAATFFYLQQLFLFAATFFICSDFFLLAATSFFICRNLFCLYRVQYLICVWPFLCSDPCGPPYWPLIMSSVSILVPRATILPTCGRDRELWLPELSIPAASQKDRGSGEENALSVATSSPGVPFVMRWKYRSKGSGPLGARSCQLKNGYNSPTSMGTPPFFTVIAINLS